MSRTYNWDRDPWHVQKTPVLTWIPDRYVKYEVVWANWGKNRDPWAFAIYRKITKNNWYDDVKSGYIGEFDFEVDVRADKKADMLPPNCLYTDVLEITHVMEMDYTNNIHAIRHNKSKKEI